MWDNFKRRPKKVEFEQHICLISGSESFKMCSPIFRKNIYVGVLQKLKSDVSPLDFFDIDYNHFPFAK